MTMPDLSMSALQLAWPVALALAWIAGEFGYRWTGLPRISIYGLIGFVFANTWMGRPPDEDGTLMLLANVGFGLILFELGYRINLRWLRLNPWISVTGIAEAAATFIAVYAVAVWFGMPLLIALLLGSLAMSTSPAGILRVANELASSGQVTERILHLSALDCVLAVFAFKVILGIGVFQTSGSFMHAAWNSLIVLGASAMLGAVFGVTVPGLLRRLGSLARDATSAFAIAVILLVAVASSFKLSPVLATLTFGIVARHRRVTLSRTQRNFGVMGDVLTVILFFFIATTLDWQRVAAGAFLGGVLVAVRFATKTTVVALFARASGVSWRKGALTGMALAPMSVFAVMLLEQDRHVGTALLEALLPLSAMVLMLELVGPWITQRTLILANETPDTVED
jgi:Kef-type K+ transport system membrane component KefB